ncbi:MAG: metal-dependent transcriptional regulator [Armatimonadetes bacterium]|nr:metal-dependent transcriptional regulator [Armatimonadota bacterium]
MSRNVNRPFSPSVEDYVKVIYKLQQSGESVSTNAVSRRMKTTPAAASKMFKVLADMKLIEHTPYYGAKLTLPGEKVALEVIRHHRLLELYLHQALGYGWDEVDAEAEKLEHHISEEFEDRIDQMLDYPKLDPHGDPIPTREGTIEPLRGTSLVDSEAGETVTVLRVQDDDPSALRFLAKMGVRLNGQIRVVDKQPFNGPLTLQIAESEHTLGRELAGQIFVESYSEQEIAVGGETWK